MATPGANGLKRQKLMDGFKNVNLNDVTASIVEKYFFLSDDDAGSSIRSA